LLGPGASAPGPITAVGGSVRQPASDPSNTSTPIAARPRSMTNYLWKSVLEGSGKRGCLAVRRFRIRLGGLGRGRSSLVPVRRSMVARSGLNPARAPANAPTARALRSVCRSATGTRPNGGDFRVGEIDRRSRCGKAPAMPPRRNAPNPGCRETPDCPAKLPAPCG
jgi:hypothetical protein